LYKLAIDYHTHTRYSHGRGTILDNVEAARAKELKSIAITDHGFRHFLFGITYSDIKKMRDEVTLLNQRFSDIDVLLGVESNLISLDGDIDIPDEYLGFFDVILMGFHLGARPASFRDGKELIIKNVMDKLGLMHIDELRERNTNAVIRALERHPISILTHPGAKIDIDSRKLAKAATLHCTALEINSSHGYMNLEHVKIALEEGASFAITSDAHTPDQVGDFKRGIEIAKAAGVPPCRIINSIEYIDLHKKGKKLR
jgi:putative hydrolase